MIPKIIHQIFLNDDIPTEYVEYINKWKSMYPDCIHILWNKQLVEEKFKDELKLIEDIYYGDYHPVLKGDILRFMIIAKYGGLYVDCDIEPIKHMDDYFFDYDFFSGYQVNQHTIELALFAATPGFFLIKNYLPILIYRVREYILKNKQIDYSKLPQITIPCHFSDYYYEIVKNNPERYNIRIFDFTYFFPYNWNECYKESNNWELDSRVYSIHKWRASWRE